MNWKAMADKAKQTFQQRGGSKAAKEDAEELRNIAQGQGSITDKAKDAQRHFASRARTALIRLTRT